MSQKIDVLSKFPDAAQLGELYGRAGCVGPRGPLGVL